LWCLRASQSLRWNSQTSHTKKRIGREFPVGNNLKRRRCLRRSHELVAFKRKRVFHKGVDIIHTTGLQRKMCNLLGIITAQTNGIGKLEHIIVEVVANRFALNEREPGFNLFGLKRFVGAQLREFLRPIAPCYVKAR